MADHDLLVRHDRGFNDHALEMSQEWTGVSLL